VIERHASLTCTAIHATHASRKSRPDNVPGILSTSSNERNARPTELRHDTR
jgi:hypothetical protein